MEKLKYENLLPENIDPNKILHQLTRVGVFTYSEYEIIKGKQSRKDKSELLMTILATKGPRARKELVKILEKHDSS